MTVTTKAFVFSKFMENAQTTQYTATNVTAIIDKVSVTNITAGAVTLAVNLVNSGGTASTANLFISAKSLQPNETYLCPEIVGQTLQNGQFISTIAGTASALAFRVSGREIS